MPAAPRAHHRQICSERDRCCSMQQSMPESEASGPLWRHLGLPAMFRTRRRKIQSSGTQRVRLRSLRCVPTAIALRNVRLRPASLKGSTKCAPEVPHMLPGCAPRCAPQAPNNAPQRLPNLIPNMPPNMLPAPAGLQRGPPAGLQRGLPPKGSPKMLPQRLPERRSRCVPAASSLRPGAEADAETQRQTPRQARTCTHRLASRLRLGLRPGCVPAANARLRSELRPGPASRMPLFQSASASWLRLEELKSKSSVSPLWQLFPRVMRSSSMPSWVV